VCCIGDVEENVRYSRPPHERSLLRAYRKGTMSYTGLMKSAGVDDSRTLIFHLRKMQDFTKKKREER